MDTIAVVDFGGQYSHLISRRIRENGVYSTVVDPENIAILLKSTPDLKGIILSGGAASVYDAGAPKCDASITNFGVPVLGICYGHQLLAVLCGGDVKQGDSGEYGTTELRTLDGNKLLAGFGNKEMVWMNHKDIVCGMPDDYSTVASTSNSPIAVFENVSKNVYGVQFHPEVSHTTKGDAVLRNFIFRICKAEKSWDVENIANRLVDGAKASIGNKKAIVALSGGIDSSVAAMLVSRAIGKNLIAVYVDTGLMRANETDAIMSTFSRYDLDLRIMDGREKFFSGLKGVTDPEEKRRIIGRLFIEIFTEVAKKEGAEFLVQGTIYSDRIESGITKHSANIKSHHNVGGLPKDMELKLHEPLKEFYKDEVRKIAKSIGLPNEMTSRHVFPGPGMAIRIIGEVTPEKAEIVRKANTIVEEEMRKAELYDKVWMAFAVLLPIKTVGIQGDSRSYKYPIAIRVIESADAMTANFAKIPYEVLEKISTRITNEISEVNRVVYDISNKPPATMEWE
ncbi:MAG: glutamine-hydrolyzing GMP synthase [Candidatus Aenigmatarchaeota archaeon]